MLYVCAGAWQLHTNPLTADCKHANYEETSLRYENMRFAGEHMAFPSTRRSMNRNVLPIHVGRRAIGYDSRMQMPLCFCSRINLRSGNDPVLRAAQLNLQFNAGYIHQYISPPDGLIVETVYRSDHDPNVEWRAWPPHFDPWQHYHGAELHRLARERASIPDRVHVSLQWHQP